MSNTVRRCEYSVYEAYFGHGHCGKVAPFEVEPSGRGRGFHVCAEHARELHEDGNKVDGYDDVLADALGGEVLS